LFVEWIVYAAIITILLIKQTAKIFEAETSHFFP